MERTKYEKTWIIGHDALAQMWEKEALEYLSARGFGADRLICRIGSTLNGTQLEGKVHGVFMAAIGPPIGNRPEWMCLDSNLNADWERWTKHLCAFTSDLPYTDARWCGLGTPKEVAATMRQAWASIPELRIRQDILRYPSALQAVVDATPPAGCRRS